MSQTEDAERALLEDAESSETQREIELLIGRLRSLLPHVLKEIEHATSVAYPRASTPYGVQLTATETPREARMQFLFASLKAIVSPSSRPLVNDINEAYGNEMASVKADMENLRDAVGPPKRVHPPSGLFASVALGVALLGWFYQPSNRAAHAVPVRPPVSRPVARGRLSTRSG